MGRILADSPAGGYLAEQGVAPRHFDSFGVRRGNWAVMVRGTFDYVALRNALVAPLEGGVTRHLPSGEVTSIYEASRAYGKTPLLVIAGREYGAGSSRDWAAKGTALLGVKAVIAESYERIHRANLIGMGVLPLEFEPGQSAATLGLTGAETFDVFGLHTGVRPGQRATVVAHGDGGPLKFAVRCRIDTDLEARAFRAGGILALVLRELTGGTT